MGVGLGQVSVDDILVTTLSRINVSGGDILHAVKRGDFGFIEFGEAYFSIIEASAIKAWKRHSLMTLNLRVPLGCIQFVFFDNKGKSRQEIVGEDRYVRLTVPPGIWFGFKGLSEYKSMVLNVADLKHSDAEVERKDTDYFEFLWDIEK